MYNKFVFIVIIIILYTIIYFNYKNNSENYTKDLEIDYNQNYNFDYEKNKLYNKYTSPNNITVALSPIPTLNCTNIKNKNKCLENGCNWINNYCSSIYPSLL